MSEHTSDTARLIAEWDAAIMRYGAIGEVVAAGNRMAKALAALSGAAAQQGDDVFSPVENVRDATLAEGIIRQEADRAFAGMRRPITSARALFWLLENHQMAQMRESDAYERGRAAAQQAEPRTPLVEQAIIGLDEIEKEHRDDAWTLRRIAVIRRALEAEPQQPQPDSSVAEPWRAERWRQGNSSVAKQPQPGEPRQGPPMQYRKKPIEVEAWQWLFSPEQVRDPVWVRDALWKWPEVGGIAFEPEHPDGPRICIATLDAVAIALPGDWIVRDVQGELYPCKPDIFAATYDPVGSAQPGEQERALRSLRAEIVAERERCEAHPNAIGGPAFSHYNGFFNGLQFVLERIEAALRALSAQPQRTPADNTGAENVTLERARFDIRTIIRSCRTQWREMSLRALAAAAGLTQVRLGEIERGVGEPADVDELARIFAALASPEQRTQPEEEG